MPNQKPRRKKCSSLAEAEKNQAEWEADRQRISRGMRQRATSLSNEALLDAENAWAVAKKLGHSSLLDAILAAGKPNATQLGDSVSPMKTYQQLFDLFVEFHREHASKSQADKVRQNAKIFGDHVGWATDITKITTQDIQKWLAKRTAEMSKKTYNNVLNDVSRVFSWACEPAQRFLRENPAGSIKRYNGRVLAHGARQILTTEACIELMRCLEREHREWIFPFSLMLFAGIRPGYHDGEINKLMRCANRDGIEPYIANGVIHLTAEITKDRRARQFPIPANLASWIRRYTPSKGKFVLGSKESYAVIREKFSIPHDGLRHTTISAHVMKKGSLALAAIEFGNSETIIRRHYFSRMTPEQTEAFYNIYPTD